MRLFYGAVYAVQAEPLKVMPHDCSAESIGAACSASARTVTFR